VLAGAREILLDRTPGGAIPAPTGPASRSDKWHLICLAAILVLLPVAVWVLSLLGRPIFYPRYLIPSALGWTILLASGAQRLVYGHTQLTFPPKGTRVCWALVLTSVSAVLLALPLIYAIRLHTEPLPGSSDNVYGHQSLPIVVQGSHAFMVRHHYSVRPAAISTSSIGTARTLRRADVSVSKNISTWTRFAVRFHPSSARRSSTPTNS
jgi:hypothetical protein